MYIKKLKINKVQRFLFLKVEIKLILLKFLYIYKNLFTKKHLFEKFLLLNTYPNSFHKSRINSICILTGRYGSVYRYFRISRIMLRKLGGFNLIYGLRKSS